MNSINLQIQILAMAAITEVEAMKADNALRAVRGKEPAYNEDDFMLKAGELEGLASGVIHG